MKERPILFSGPMVRAILEGHKTQTRRIVKAGTCDDWNACPYGVVGDRLWVRETWATDASLNDKAPSQFSKWPVIYVADNKVNMCGALHGNTGGKIRQSIFMPRWASRITLEITGVRIEQAQDISEADAIAEGLIQWSDPPRMPDTYYGLTRADVWETDPRKAYARLWDEINGKRACWKSNPFVWVIQYKPVEESHAKVN